MSETLLPPSATAQERALDLATARVGDVSVPLRTLWDPDTCPASLLPWLAWALAVDAWDPAASESVKRQAIRDSVSVHRRKGTAGALLTALAPYDVDVEEWQDQSPVGIPYTFALLAGAGLTDPQKSAVIDIANRVKNARSHFSFRHQNDGGNFYAAAACVAGGVISVLAYQNEPEVTAWAVRVAAAGGTYTQADLMALDDLVRAYKAIGITEATARVNAFCGGDLTAALHPVFRGGGSDADTNVNFVAGDYARATGLTGNASTKRLTMGINADGVGTDNSYSIAAYVRSATTASATLVGASDGTGSARLVHLAGTSGSYFCFAAGGSDGRISVTATQSKLIIGSRTANNDCRYYRDGAAVGSPNTTVRTNVRPPRAFSVFAFNNNGTQQVFSNASLGGYHVGPGVDSTQAASLATAWQTYCTALGRQV
ncbi:MAG: hypothetical protein RLZZ127_1563 [Planctomycetota bacterium]|jgi:phage tail P2-like protein